MRAPIVRYVLALKTLQVTLNCQCAVRVLATHEAHTATPSSSGSPLVTVEPDVASSSFRDDTFSNEKWAWIDAFSLTDCIIPLVVLPSKFGELCQAHIIRHIMRDRLIRDPADSRGNKLMFLLPAMLFSSFKLRGGFITLSSGVRKSNKDKEFRKRAEMFVRGEWAELWNRIFPRDPRPRRSALSDADKKVKVLKHIAEGNLRKARQTLNPSAFAPKTLDTAESLLALHPSSTSDFPADIINFVPVEPFVLDREIFNAVISDLPRGNAPGRSGWRYENIADICSPGGYAADSMFLYFRRAFYIPKIKSCQSALFLSCEAYQSISLASWSSVSQLGLMYLCVKKPSGCWRKNFPRTSIILLN